MGTVTIDGPIPGNARQRIAHYLRLAEGERDVVHVGVVQLPDCPGQLTVSVTYADGENLDFCVDPSELARQPLDAEQLKAWRGVRHERCPDCGAQARVRPDSESTVLFCNADRAHQWRLYGRGYW